MTTIWLRVTNYEGFVRNRLWLCLDKFLAFSEQTASSWSRFELGIFLYEARVISPRLQDPHFKVIDMTDISGATLS
jgi:hypothetical protein